jgi:hypothetical protein
LARAELFGSVLHPPSPGHPFVAEGSNACQPIIDPNHEPIMGVDGLLEQPEPVDNRGSALTRLASPIDGVLGLENGSDLGQGETKQFLEFADVSDPPELCR